ncbi:ribonuclease H-like domain-containing protein [Dipodascopsis tothii]|uniref:ribonuclease H-like domain-containing protein n=1 Tax=Dipodascopsis tothii TaxID=44089 RepID=UPI0034CDB4AB
MSEPTEAPAAAEGQAKKKRPGYKYRGKKAKKAVVSVAPSVVSTATVLAGATQLSSNWAKLQAAKTPAAEARPAKRARPGSAKAKPASVTKHGHKDLDSLLEWADDNGISMEDMKAAYGDDLGFPGAHAPETADRTKAKVRGKKMVRPVEIDESKGEIGRYVALDCEFVGVGPEGKESALARVSIVNFHGTVVLDCFVRPKERVTDWRTWVSGVRPEDMAGARSFEEVQAVVSDILKDRVLVGHAINHDLKALQVAHPRSQIRDTSKHPDFKKLSKGRTPGLKRLAKEILGQDIQGAEHSSVEDARACILLYRKYKNDFEKLSRQKSYNAPAKAAEPVGYLG